MPTPVLAENTAPSAVMFTVTPLLSVMFPPSLFTVTVPPEAVIAPSGMSPKLATMETSLLSPVAVTVPIVTPFASSRYIPEASEVALIVPTIVSSGLALWPMAPPASSVKVVAIKSLPSCVSSIVFFAVIVT